MKIKMTPKIKHALLIGLLVMSYSTLPSCSKDTGLASIKESSNKDEPEQTISYILSIEPTVMAEDQLPKVRLFEKYNPANSYPVKTVADPKNAINFEISTEQLPAGQYRLIIDIPIQSNFLGISTGSRIKTITHDIVIHDTLAGSCFNFDDKQEDVMGWSSSHVFIVARDQPISKPTCPGLFFVNTSWPAKLNETTEGGSMFVPISSECFPTTSNQMSEDPHWRFSLKSPDLATRTDWQEIKSINFRVATNKIPIKILPEVHYSIDNKKTSTIFKDILRKKLEIAGEGWNTIEYPFELPTEAIVSGIELHVYGVPEQTVGTEVNSVFIDGVCPKK